MRIHPPEGPTCLREFEIASSAHGAMSANRDRGFGYLDLLPSTAFEEPTMPLVALELNLNAKPPLSRALVFSNAVEFAFDKAVAVGVWNNHTRLLLPAAETTPEAWKRWHGISDTVVIRWWGGWESTSNPDSTRAHFSLDPCLACLRNIRAPANESTRYAGVSEDWWGRWNPCPHNKEPTTTSIGAPMSAFPEMASGDTSYVGRGFLSSEAETSPGCAYPPDFSHMWRTVGPCRKGIPSYIEDMADEHRKEGIVLYRPMVIS